MARYVAFLRGMNVGGRRIRNEELQSHLEALGFSDVRPFLASGNLVLDASFRSSERVGLEIETGLREALGYEVPTLVRSAREVVAIAGGGPFHGERGGGGGKPQVLFLPRAPEAAARETVLALATGADQLAFDGTELHWLPEAGISTSELDLASIERAVGPTTTRTRNTIERLAAKFLV